MDSWLSRYTIFKQKAIGNTMPKLNTKIKTQHLTIVVKTTLMLN